MRLMGTRRMKKKRIGRKIVKCPRCGGDHDMLTFKKMERSMGKFTHWAECPRTGDPVMLNMTSREQEGPKDNDDS